MSSYRESLAVDINGVSMERTDLVKGVVDGIIYRIVSIDDRGYVVVACGRTVKRVSPRKLIWLGEIDD